MTPQRPSKAIDDYPSKFDWPGMKGLNTKGSATWVLENILWKRCWCGFQSAVKYDAAVSWLQENDALVVNHSELLPWPKKTATPIMHKIRTLFLSRNITRLARWHNVPRLRASLHRSAIKLDCSISPDRNSVLILCIIVVAVFFFFFGQGSRSRWIQPVAVKLVLWRHWMHLTQVHSMTSENQFHCHVLYWIVRNVLRLL